MRLDPAVRVAMKIAHEDGLDPESVRELYEKMVLGEITIESMLQGIYNKLSDEGLKNTFSTITSNLVSFRS